MKVKDYMKKKPVKINEDKDLADVVKKMVKGKTNTVVVTNKENKPVGIVSSLCLIKEVLPDYLKDNPSVSTFEREGQLTCFTLKRTHKKVKDFMIKEIHNLHPNDAVVSATAWASQSRTRTLPVVDDNDKLVGVIDRTGIKKAIYDSIFEVKEPNCGIKGCK